MKIFKETGDSRYIYKNELDKACFQHVMLKEILKIYIEKQLLIRSYVRKHLIFLKTQNLIDINFDMLQWFINYLIKNLLHL